MKHTRSLLHRMDRRSYDEFKKSIQYHTKKEFEYIIDFVNRRNGKYGRRKRDYMVYAWGAKSTEVFEKADKRYYRPDFLLLKAFDNSYLVRTIAPIEVATTKVLSPVQCYLKCSKVDREYDKVTPEIATTQQYILFIRGNDGYEMYSLLTPKRLDRIKKNGIVKPSCMGKKPCYWFNTIDIKWKMLYPETYHKQMTIEGNPYATN